MKLTLIEQHFDNHELCLVCLDPLIIVIILSFGHQKRLLLHNDKYVITINIIF